MSGNLIVCHRAGGISAWNRGDRAQRAPWRFSAARMLGAVGLLLASASCFAEPGVLATKLVAGSPWTITASMPRFTPFTWTFRLSADGKLERRRQEEWREQEIHVDGTITIEGRDGATYTIQLDDKGEPSLDRTNLRVGARVRMEPTR